MSHAEVGQRSAHNPQCTHTFSSFAITRFVFNWVETYRSCVLFVAGTFNMERRSPSSAFSVKEIQAVGQISIHASHSIHLSVVKTVCISQFRQRSASLNPVFFSKPNSTSFLRSESVTFFSACGTT